MITQEEKAAKEKSKAEDKKRNEEFQAFLQDPNWQERANSIDPKIHAAAMEEHRQKRETLWPPPPPGPPPPPLPPLSPEQRWRGMSTKGVRDPQAMDELFALRNDPAFVASMYDTAHPSHHRARALWQELHDRAYGA